MSTTKASDGKEWTIANTYICCQLLNNLNPSIGRNSAVKKKTASTIFMQMKKNIITLILEKIPRPILTPFSIDIKSSSEITISDTSFATSVPVIPIAIPVLANLSARESLIPSPVIATIRSCSWYLLIIFSLSDGTTLAKTDTLLKSSIGKSSIFFPSTTISPSSKRSIFFAIASAVAG